MGITIKNIKLSPNAASRISSAFQKGCAIIANSIPKEGALIGVRKEFLTKYLALEYGVAGLADSEKAEFISSKGVSAVFSGRTSIANKVEIKAKLAKRLRFFITKGSRSRLKGNWRFDLKVGYTGVKKYKNRGIVRPLLRKSQEDFRRLIPFLLKKRFKIAFAYVMSHPKQYLKYDEKLRKLYIEAFNHHADNMLAEIKRRTPQDKARELAGSSREQQIRAWNRMYGSGYKRRTLKHLNEDGYYIKYIKE